MVDDHNPDAGIGYAFLQKFTKNSAEEFDVAVQQLELRLGRRLSGLVLDLRRNPGGPLNTCLELTNRFLREGKLVTIKPRNQPKIRSSSGPAKRRGVSAVMKRKKPAVIYSVAACG